MQNQMTKTEVILVTISNLLNIKAIDSSEIEDAFINLVQYPEEKLIKTFRESYILREIIYAHDNFRYHN